jgi:hypothetical protein
MKQSAIRKQAKNARRRKRVEKRQKKESLSNERRENSIKIRVEEYNKDVVSKDFVSQVLDALKNLRLNDRRFFRKKEENFWKLMKEIGFQECVDNVLKNAPYEDRILMMKKFLLKMGTVIFSILQKKNKLLQYIPYNDVVISPKGDEFIIIFDALLRHKTE